MQAGIGVDSTPDKSAICSAAYRGHLDIVKALLNHGVSIETQDEYGRTPFLNAAISSMDTPIVLQKQCANARIVAEYLATQGANINHAEKWSGDTALITAVYRNDTDIVLWFLSLGVDAGLQNKKGQAALDVAKAKDYPKIAKCIKGFLLSQSPTMRKPRLKIPPP